MSTPSPSIAVIGIACWYPDAPNPVRLWENVLSRRRQFRQMPDCRLPLNDYYHPDPDEPDKTYGRQAAVIDGFDFDWASRRIPLSTFMSTDITHWLSLEVAINALKDAGYPPGKIPGELTGVIVGNSLTGEQSRAGTMRLRWPFIRRALRAAASENNLAPNELKAMENRLKAIYTSVFPRTTEDTLAGGLSNTIPGRICNFLDLNGGGYVVDGACSSSLIAVATAASKLFSGDLDMALAGGVDISLDSFELIGFSKTRALTDNEMNVYDRKGDGFIPGEGCAFVVLKRLADAQRDNNTIYAVIRGWGISSDGGGTGLTAPSAKGQARAIEKAYTMAPYSARDLVFIEGHGTGTAVGDRTELEAISLAMRGDQNPDTVPAPRSCGMTSLKSIIGHTKAASGIGGFIKAVTGVNRRILPPTAACSEPLPIFNSVASSLYPVMSGQVLKTDHPIRAGVSSMGFGGINCHVTLESQGPPSQRLATSLDERALMASNQTTELFVFSDDSESALAQQIESVKSNTQGLSYAELTDLAARLAKDVRPNARCRSAFLASSPDELVEQLDRVKQQAEHANRSDQPRIDPLKKLFYGNPAGKPRIGMLFPGQGSQKLNMAGMLVNRFQWARDLVGQADNWIKQAGGQAVSPLIYRHEEQAFDSRETDGWLDNISDTRVAQPAICLCSLLWLQFLETLGITPHAAGGHSLGELTAFHAAGAFSQKDLIGIAAVRGKAMAASVEHRGTMLSLFCDARSAQAIVDQVQGYLVLANINSPRQVVLSGDTDAVRQAAGLCKKKGIKTHALKVSNAFHSRLADGAAKVLEKDPLLSKDLDEPLTMLFTSTTGDRIQQGLPLGDHFSQQVLSQVDYVTMIQNMARECELFIEVGPGRVLTGLTRDILGPQGPPCLPIESGPFHDRDLNTLVAGLFVHGVDIYWERFYAGRLIRPFVPASDRTFIENPCEKKFEPQHAGQDLPDPDTDTYRYETGAIDDDLSLLTGITGLNRTQLANYLDVRKDFITDVIRSDIKHTGILGKPGGSADPSESSQALDTATDTPVSDEADPSAVQSTLYSLIHEVTGFPQESLDPGMKLLDDLNLDSIKAGDIIAKTARSVGYEGDLESLDLANAALAEVVALLEQSGSPPVSAADIRKTLYEHASRVTGYPQDILEQDHLLEQDLNIGEEKLHRIIQSTASDLGVEASLDLAPLLARTMDQIAGILERVVHEQQPHHHEALPNEPDSWIREFKTELVERPFVPMQQHFTRRVEDSWENSNTLILGASEDDSLMAAFKQTILGLGARVTAEYFTSPAKAKTSRLGDFSHILLLLPMESNEQESSREQLIRVVSRLSRVTALPPAARAPRRRTTLAFIQFGGGYFGKHPAFSRFERCSAHALAAGIHLERSDLRIRVLDFSVMMDEDDIARMSVQEISTPDAFSAVGFDHDMTRRIMVHYLIEPESYTARHHSWAPQDVILVTGGAKGITAACALALAEKTGASMALVGRSEPPPENAPPDNDISRTLEAFSRKGLRAAYFSCDVSDKPSVTRLIQAIVQHMGKITGVIHGAGLNVPRPAKSVTPQSAMKEISPKVLGALHLFDALKGAPLKQFCALTSIIGVTGMPGNAWYGFSNEALELIVRRYQALYGFDAISMAYSIWRDEGMGARLGSVTQLKRQGIDAIPSTQGVERFVRLFLNDPGTDQAIVTARLKGLDTWNPSAVQTPTNLRFLEEQLDATCGVESVFKAHLSLETDPYLRDHNFNGSYLFPTVFGLEAMAQAASHAIGHPLPETVTIKDIELARPITVDPDNGASIIIRALKEEAQPGSSMTVVQASITTGTARSGTAHFSARYILDKEDPDPPKEAIQVSGTALTLDPKQDLYHASLLFQGPLFHRIESVHTLSDDSAAGMSAVFSAAVTPGQHAAALSFPHFPGGQIILGDPFFRDALLQSALLLVPEKTCLPVSIREIRIYDPPFKEMEAEDMRLPAKVTVTGMAEDEIEYTVVSTDQDHGVVQCLEGYRVKVLKTDTGNPEISDLIDPEHRDNRMVKEAVSQACTRLKLIPPKIRLKPIPGIHDLNKDERHDKEMPLIRDLLHSTPGAKTSLPNVAWEPDGKPVIKDRHDLAISISHDDRICLGVAGTQPQGCDTAPVTPRSREQWQVLLGKAGADLLDQLTHSEHDTALESSPLDRAGTRIWAAREAVKKATGDNSPELVIVEQDGENCLFKSGKIMVLTLAIRLTWGPERIIALVVGPGEDSEKRGPDIITGYETLFNMDHIGMHLDGPQGQGVFYQCFHVGFRPSAQLSRKVYFTNYCFWLGEVREASVWPVLKTLGDQFTSGQFGQVTNDTHLTITGEATVKDRIEVLLWASGNKGPADSTMELTYDFRKILADGTHERVARCIQNTTWVEVLGHGIVKPKPYPDYYWKFMESPHILLLPQNENPNTLEALPEPLIDLAAACDSETVIYNAPQGPEVTPIIHEQPIETSLSESNLVGNVYFANYFSWQAQTRDKYVYSLAPEYFRGTGEKGELICLESRVEHLREAMPFDRILVTMALKRLTRCSATLFFEYFRAEESGKKTKLAFGEQQAAWVTRDDSGNPRLTEFPGKIATDFEQQIKG
ncbi:MAG: SDR family NAD(P)-dependent oxidoreductase [Desulfobacteraceae bacterium]|nr:MAG: SDR family NAD(P)-dependent oxidoreductase [Desulfobacteraceae bacterium]